MRAEGGPGQGVKACGEPVAAENVAVEPYSNVSMTAPAKGVEVQSPASPGKTADRMAQALRYC